MRHTQKKWMIFWSRETMPGAEQETPIVVMTSLRTTHLAFAVLSALPPIITSIALTHPLPCCFFLSLKGWMTPARSLRWVYARLLPFPRFLRGADQMVCSISCQLMSENKNNGKQSRCGCCGSCSIYVIQNRRDFYSQIICFSGWPAHKVPLETLWL